MSDSQTTCSAIKDSFLAYFAERVGVSAVDQICVLKLPLKTLDDRYVEVYIESKMGDFVLVHDGGNAVAELFLQGIHMTDTKETQMRRIARRYEVSFEDNTFTIGSPARKVQQAILAIAQCTSLAMYDLLKHQPLIEDEPVAALVHRSLKTYRPNEVEVRYRVPVKGHEVNRDHVFDAVAFPKVSGRRTVAVKALGTAYSPQIQMDRFGFLALNIRGTPYDKWPRLTVIARADKWRKEELAAVRKLSTKTIELTADDEELLKRLPGEIDQLAA